jgi:hypothetical protein
VTFTAPRSGDVIDYYSQHFVVAFVTNTSQRAIRLEPPEVQWEVNGHLFGGLANLWGGTNGHCIACVSFLN